MPRLGNNSGINDDDNHDDDDTRPLVGGRHGGRGTEIMNRNSLFIRMILLLSFYFLMRNILIHDYREDMRIALKNGGKSDDEIDRIVPKTIIERRQTNIEKEKKLEQLIERVDNLEKEIENLKQQKS